MQFERSIDASGEATLAPLPEAVRRHRRGPRAHGERPAGRDEQLRHRPAARARRRRPARSAASATRGSQGDDDVSMRVIADHARTTAFLIAEGVFPDRAGREYVLRRVMRRAIRHGHRLGIREPFLHEVALEVVALMGDAVSRARARARSSSRAWRAARRCASARRSSAASRSSTRRSTALRAGGETRRRRRDRVQALRHVRLPARPDAGHRAGARLHVDDAGYDARARGAARAQRGLEGRRGGRRPRVARRARGGRRRASPRGREVLGYEREEGEGTRRRDRQGRRGSSTGRSQGEEAVVVTDVDAVLRRGGRAGRRRGRHRACAAPSRCASR